MTSSSVRVVAVGLCALVALGIAVYVFIPSGRTPELPRDASARSDPPSQGVPVSASRPTSGDVEALGNISGEVFLSGAPPAMQPLKLGADPVCANASSHDEQVIAANGRLKNVFVRLSNAPAQRAPSDPVVVDQVSCVFRPRVQGAVRGQTVQIRNSDSTLHNVHGYAGSATIFNYAQPASSKAVERKFSDRSSIIKLKCDVHPWMTAYVIVNENAYFAVSGADGKFSIPSVPAGTYRIEAWHERFGIKATDVIVRASQTSAVAFTYSPDDRG